MTTSNESPEFICTVCARALRIAHVPPTVPSCPSCGAVTRPNDAMRALAGEVRCMKCEHTEPAYEHSRCPECDTVYVTFAVKVAHPAAD